MSRPTKDQLFLFEAEGWVNTRYLDDWTLEQKLGQRTIRMRPNIGHLNGEYRVRPFESIDDETYSDVVKRISTWDTEIEHGTWAERRSGTRFANPSLTAEFVKTICSQVSKWAIELDIRDLAEKRLVEEAQYRWVNYRQLFDAAYLGRVDLCEKFLAEFHSGKFDDSAAVIKQEAFDRAIEVAKTRQPPL